MICVCNWNRFGKYLLIYLLCLCVYADGSIECVCMGRDCIAQQCKGDQCYSSVTVKDGVPSLHRGCLIGPDSRSLTCLASPSVSHVIECCAQPICNANTSLESLMQLLLKSEEKFSRCCRKSLRLMKHMQAERSGGRINMALIVLFI